MSKEEAIVRALATSLVHEFKTISGTVFISGEVIAKTIQLLFDYNIEWTGNSRVTITVTPKFKDGEFTMPFTASETSEHINTVPMLKSASEDTRRKVMEYRAFHKIADKLGIKPFILKQYFNVKNLSKHSSG